MKCTATLILATFLLFPGTNLSAATFSNIPLTLNPTSASGFEIGLGGDSLPIPFPLGNFGIGGTLRIDVQADGSGNISQLRFSSAQMGGLVVPDFVQGPFPLSTTGTGLRLSAATPSAAFQPVSPGGEFSQSNHSYTFDAGTLQLEDIFSGISKVIDFGADPAVLNPIGSATISSTDIGGGQFAIDLSLPFTDTDVVVDESGSFFRFNAVITASGIVTIPEPTSGMNLALVTTTWLIGRRRRRISKQLSD